MILRGSPPYPKFLSFAIKTIITGLYFSVIKPLIYNFINNINNYINNLDDASSDSTILSFVKNHKTSISFACDITTELLIPVGDCYIIQNLAVNGVALVFDARKLNTLFQNPIFIHSSPVFFRSTSILLELSDQCKKQEISTIKEMPIRASEFTGWYFFFNFYLETRLQNKAALSLANKLLAIYSIRFLDQLEYKLLENSQRPLFSSQLIIPPLFKNPVTTLCKLPVDTFFRSLLIRHGFEVSCNFLGELLYNHVENHLKHNTSLLSFGTNTSYTAYLFSKSIWKTAHQNLEKHATSANTLDKQLGYRVMAFFAPRNYITKKLKTIFAMKDSADYLDPDLVELSDFIGIHPVSIKSTDSLLLTAQTHGICLSSPRIENKILNITNNLWGWAYNITDEHKGGIMLCTAKRFYSEEWERIRSNNGQIEDFATLNLATKILLNSSAESCLMESVKIQSSTEWPYSSFSDFMTYFVGVTNSYLNYWLTSTNTEEI